MRINKKIEKGVDTLGKVYEYYRYLLPFSRENRAGRKIGSDRLISIFSEPRGGSSWVSDIFCHLPDSILVWEPMYLIPPYRELKDIGFCFHQYIPEGCEWPEAEEFFRKLYNMEVSSFRSFKLYHLNKTLRRISSAKHFVYKDCCSNMLLPWLTGKFEINPVYVIRHPCAVIASQLKFGHWDYILKDVKAYFPNPADRFKEIYLQYQDIIDSITRPEERLAAEWALHNSVPIKHPLNDIRWISVAYEKLYKDPESELDRIFYRLKIPMPTSILPNISSPSVSTRGNSTAKIRSGQQLESWRKSLDDRQVRNILRILKEFKMDFYDESPEPDYQRIYAATSRS